MKKVFSNTQEVAHVWAQFNQDQGRNGGHSVFFCGNTIYSYGSHFPMAHRIGDTTTILINDDSYSATTSSHQREVINAIPQFYNTINVSTEFIHCIADTCRFNKKEAIKERENQLLELVELYKKQSKARVRDYSTAIAYLQSNIRAFCKLYKISISPLETMLKDTSLIVEKSIAKQKRIKAAAIRAEKKRRLERVELAKIELDKWLKGWHGNRFYLMGLPPHLRVHRDTKTNLPTSVETSHGVTLDYKDAERLACAYQKGVIYVKNSGVGVNISYTGEKEPRFGHYSIDSIYINGDMIMGCHHFEAKILQDFIKLNGWG